jgi:hypothetical protein
MEFNGTKKGQMGGIIGALTSLLVGDLVAIILLIMLQTTVTTSLANFTGIVLLVMSNIMPIGGIILLLFNVAFIGYFSGKR